MNDAQNTANGDRAVDQAPCLPAHVRHHWQQQVGGADALHVPA